MLSPRQVLDSYFPEVRARLLEIAAIMDRFDPAAGGGAGHVATDDRLKQYAESLKVLTAPAAKANRAEKIQLIFSDPV